MTVTAAHPIALPEKVEMKKTREGFGRALVDLGEQDPRIVVLVGDLTESTMVSFFAERFPDRFIQVGIAEQNMACVAAGLAAMGRSRSGRPTAPSPRAARPTRSA